MATAQPIALPRELQAILAHLDTAEVPDNQRWLIRLLRRQGHQVLTLLWRMLGTEADALDAYQNAVCHMAGRGPDAARNAAGYFYRTAMNAGISILRNRRMRARQWPGIVENQVRRDADRAESSDAGQLMDQQQMLAAMRDAIYRLPPYLRDVILLRELAELPYNDVAAALGIRVGTARLYRRQAVVRLAGLLGQEAEE